MSNESWSQRASITRSILARTLCGILICSSIADNAAGESYTTLVAPPWKHTMGVNRIRQSHLNLVSGYRKKFSSPMGVAAVKLSATDKEGLGDDDELTIFGLNTGSGEIFYNRSMANLGFFGKKHKEVGDLRGCVGIAADEAGNVFVSDREQNRLLHLTMNQDNELVFKRAINPTAAHLDLDKPSGICDEADRVYIADQGNNRLVELNKEGDRLRVVADDLFAPFAVDVIAERKWNFYSSQFIVATDSLGKRLIKLSMNGDVVRVRRSHEIASDGEFGFVAIDYYSNIYVTDQETGCIYKFDRNLDYLTRMGCGSDDSKDDFDEPRGIAIHRRFGQVFVAERAGASYFWVGTDIENLQARAVATDDGWQVEVEFLLTEQSKVVVRLETADGVIVKSLRENAFTPPGVFRETYRLDAAELSCPVAECTYRITVEARATYSSRQYHSAERNVPVLGLR